MPEVPQLGQDERRALILGEAGEIAEEVAQVGPLLDLGGKPLRVRLNVLERDGLAPRAQHGEAAVAGDREQPGAEGDGLLGSGELGVGRDERLLHGIGRLLGMAEHVATERQQRPVVAVVDDLERGIVTRPKQGDETVVAGEPQGARRASEDLRATDGRSLHEVIIDTYRAKREFLSPTGSPTQRATAGWRVTRRGPRWRSAR